MKRSPLNRGTGFKPPAKPLARGEWKRANAKPLKRQPFKRKARKVPKGAPSESELETLRLEREALRLFRSGILERERRPSGLVGCECCGRAFPEDRIDAHHRKLRSQGGGHDLENGHALCNGPTGCHDRVHAHTVEGWRRFIHQTKPGSGRPGGEVSAG